MRIQVIIENDPIDEGEGRVYEVEHEITVKFLEECLKLMELFEKKQFDYGPDNIAFTGEIGCLVRNNDKIQRLLHLMGSQRGPSNESLEDTWMDLANYSIIALLYRHGLWPGGVKEKWLL